MTFTSKPDDVMLPSVTKIKRTQQPLALYENGVDNPVSLIEISEMICAKHLFIDWRRIRLGINSLVKPNSNRMLSLIHI